MKVAETMIAWTPAWLINNPTAGKIQVCPRFLRGDTDWAQPYLYLAGAKFPWVRKLRGQDAVTNIFLEFNTIVVRDGLAPEVVHKAFLSIDEYAEGLSPQTPGAR